MQMKLNRLLNGGGLVSSEILLVCSMGGYWNNYKDIHVN